MKNRYYEWKNDYKYPAPDKINISEAWRKYSLFQGLKIKKPPAPMELYFDKGKQPVDVIPNSELFLFFSKKIVDFMEATYSDKLFEAFPVKIRGKEIDDNTQPYFLINILNTKDVIDKKKSELVINKYGEINRIDRLVIIEEPFDNNDFFRLEGDSALLICSGSFKNKMMELGIKGMQFIPLGEKRI